MQRIALMAAVLALGTVLGPALAAADDSQMCRAGTTVMSVPAWLAFASAEQSLEAQLAPARPFVDADEVLWCASASDPRCNPLRDDADGIFSALAHGLLAPVIVGRTSVPRPPVSRVVRFAELGGPRDGTQTRLDRPPRG